MFFSPDPVTTVILNLVHDAVLVLDDQHLVLSVNERFWEWTSLEEEKVLGQPARGLWEDSVRWSDWVTSLRLGGAVKDTEILELKTRDGDGLAVEAHMSSVLSSRGLQGVVLVLHDLRPLRQMERLFQEDSLTGVASRAWILRRLEDDLARGEKFGTPLGVVVMDIDGFRALNDRWGSVFGDEVLRVVGAELRSVTRPVDAVGRLGNDEFLLLLAQTTQGQAKIVADRLAEGIEHRLFLPQGTKVKVTVSYGITSALPSGHETVNTILSRVLRDPHQPD